LVKNSFLFEKVRIREGKSYRFGSRGKDYDKIIVIN